MCTRAFKPKLGNFNSATMSLPHEEKEKHATVGEHIEYGSESNSLEAASLVNEKAVIRKM